jgi:hypothetical protein
MSKSLTVPAVVVVALGAVLVVQASTPFPREQQPAGRGAQAPVTAPATAPLTSEQRWARANDAWNAGKYPDALRDLKTLMQGSNASEYQDRVALLTASFSPPRTSRPRARRRS